MNKGFTLIELLAVITILAVIMLITTLSVGSILSDSKSNLSNTQKDMLESSAEAYYLKEGMADEVTCVNVSDLITKGYLDNTLVKDPKTGEDVSGSIKITYSANHYLYEYQESICE